MAKGIGFNLTTHLRDTKTGKVKSVNPYRRHVVDKVVTYERAGVFYHENGEPIKTAQAQAPVKKG